MNRKPLIIAALLASSLMASTFAAAAEKNADGIIEEKIRTLAPNAKTKHPSIAYCRFRSIVTSFM